MWYRRSVRSGGDRRTSMKYEIRGNVWQLKERKVPPDRDASGGEAEDNVMQQFNMRCCNIISVPLYCLILNLFQWGLRRYSWNLKVKRKWRLQLQNVGFSGKNDYLILDLVSCGLVGFHIACGWRFSKVTWECGGRISLWQ